MKLKTNHRPRIAFSTAARYGTCKRTGAELSGWKQAIADLNPVLWYKMDEDSGLLLADSGSAGVDLTISGGNASTAAAKTYQAAIDYATAGLEFKDGYIISAQAAHNDVMNVTGDITVGMLYKPAASPGVNFPKLWWKQTNSATGQGTWLFQRDQFNYAAPGRITGRITSNGNNYDVTTTSALVNGTTYFLLLRRSGNTVSLRINNVAQGSVAATGTNATSTLDMVVAGDQTSSNRAAGTYADMFMCNYFVTDEQADTLWSFRNG